MLTLEVTSANFFSVKVADTVILSKANVRLSGASAACICAGDANRVATMTGLSNKFFIEIFGLPFEFAWVTSVSSSATINVNDYHLQMITIMIIIIQIETNCAYWDGESSRSPSCCALWHL